MDRLISEQAVIDTIYESRNNFKNEFDQGFFADKIRALPPVNPQPKMGHWIAIDEEPHEDYECDKCGYTIWAYDANTEPHMEYEYCPNCGAKMQEVEE